MSGHGAHADPSNKKIALLIAILALFLAISETLSKAYQTEVITKQVEASNKWAFFQAKSIRKTTTEVARDSLLMAPNADDPKVQEQIAKWTATAKSYDSEPETGEGRKELTASALAAEKKAELANHKYHNLEISSGMLQVAIVLASSSIITSVVLLGWVAGLLGVVAVGFGFFAMFGAALF
jgi:hypothetical protein